jgi:hypothetical protein
MKKHTFPLMLAIVAAWLATTQKTAANVQLRVSVKFILNSSGQRPTGTLSTDDHVREQIRRGNAILARSGAGYEFVVTEIGNVSGASQWFDVDARDTGQRLLLQNAALANPSLYQLRLNTVNIYVNGNESSGNCAIAPPDQIILIGQRGRATTIPHEIGHYFGLFHTQGRFCGGCAEPPAPGAPIIGNLCSSEPDSDGIPDTLPDLQCWNQDQIAQRSFAQNYDNLNVAQRAQVDAVFFNLMSYHAEPRSRLTAGQIDRMTDSINSGRANAASGRTVFVDHRNQCVRPEDLAWPFDVLASYTPGWSWGTRNGLGITLDPRNPPPGAPFLPCPLPPLPCTVAACLGGPFKTIKDALSNTAAGNRLQIREGIYNEPMTINKAMCLTASGGPVTIGLR